MVEEDPEKRLLKYGFKKPDGSTDQEMSEESKEVGPIPTEYPKPIKRFRLVYEAFNASVEEIYFFMLDSLRYDRGYPTQHKIIDLFSASEQSAFFGAGQQRLGAQQDKVSQFLATIGKMVKELFQLVREIRIIKERLNYYRDSYDKSSKSRGSAEITLKGIWIDMVEQGAKNPASVYGMARELQFVTLPDLFFSYHPQTAREVDEEVDKLEFNRKVKEVLKRKLRTFLEWKEHTFEELKVKEKFTIKFLRQHYDIIRMYMNWVKPYLKNIKRLQMDTRRTESVDLVSAFEGSVIEIEVLSTKKQSKDKSINACVLLHFLYRTRPSMSYHQPGYQQGPIHVGKCQVDARAYAWSDEQVSNYKKMREEEDLYLLTAIDESVMAAMEEFGHELQDYLKEAEERIKDEKKEKEEKKENESKGPSFLDPWFGYFRSPAKSKAKGPKKSSEQEFSEKQERKKAEDEAKGDAYYVYHLYKKHHGMLTWT